MTILRWLWPKMKLRSERDLDSGITTYWLDTGLGIVRLSQDQYQKIDIQCRLSRYNRNRASTK